MKPKSTKKKAPDEPDEDEVVHMGDELADDSDEEAQPDEDFVQDVDDDDYDQMEL